MQIESSVRANCLKRNSLNLVNWHVKRLPHCSQTSMYALNAADTPSVPTNSLVNFNEQPMKLQRLVNHTESRRNAATELSSRCFYLSNLTYSKYIYSLFLQK